MIPYNQLNGKITTTETVRVTSCLCKSEDSAEKFRFVVHGEDSNQVREDLYLVKNWKKIFMNMFVCLFDLGISCFCKSEDAAEKFWFVIP